MIKKDRHRAANAALLASKKANEEKRKEDTAQGEEATKAELEELRAAVKKMKMEAEATRKLKEQIRRQERTIQALKNAKAGGGGGPAPDSKSRSPIGVAPSKNKKSSSGPRRALGDCSSKQNTPQHGLKQKLRRQSKESETVSREKMSEVLVEPDVLVVEEEEEERDISAEEPANHWLQQHLLKLNNANNRLDAKVVNKGQRQSNGKEYHHVEQQLGQRKPYNAADYGGDNNQFPTQSSSQPSDHPDPDVPPVVIASSALNHASEGDARGGGSAAINRHQAPAKSQILSYKNGTMKEVLPDGTTTISFANGDRKRTYANEKKGIVVYYYASTKVWSFFACAEECIAYITCLTCISDPQSFAMHQLVDNPGDAPGRDANLSLSKQTN